MRLSSAIISVSVFLSATTSAHPLEQRDVLEARGDIDVCKAILIALKASAFCSSFVPITDVTTTETKTAACKNGAMKRQLSNTPNLLFTTSRAPSTIIRALSTMPAAPSTTSKTATTSVAPKCAIQGLPSGVGAFACDVITNACRAFVKPKTQSVRYYSLLSPIGSYTSKFILHQAHILQSDLTNSDFIVITGQLNHNTKMCNNTRYDAENDAQYHTVG